MGELTNPATPATGFGLVFPDTTASQFFFKDDGGRFWGRTHNAAVAAVGPGFAVDTFITNSDLLIPSFSLQAKAWFLWRISASKTAAGLATPIYVIRTGTLRTTSDTARLTLTGPAQTAVADIGTLNVLVTARTVGTGTTAVLAGTAWWDHRGTATSSTIGVGFANDGSGHVEATSAGFDSSTLAGSYISLTINGGTSAAWTTTQAIAEANW